MSEKLPPEDRPTPEEVARYNATDWPGSEMFNPPHLRRLATNLRIELTETKRGVDQLPEIPTNIILGED